jgi:hypothetical protein
MNLNSIIFTASDYKIAISVNGITWPVSIVEDFAYGAKKEKEYIHTIGSDEPVGLKTSASTYPGSMSMEAGELEQYLIALGFVFITQLNGATISVVTYKGDLVKVFKSCVFDSHDASFKAKDKRSLVKINFDAIGVVGS